MKNRFFSLLATLDGALYFIWGIICLFQGSTELGIHKMTMGFLWGFVGHLLRETDRLRKQAQEGGQRG